MQGLHLIADAYALGCGIDLVTDAARLETLCADAARVAGLKVLNTSFHAFDAPSSENSHGTSLPSGGVTGTVLLAESHAAIHTWPELNAATLDVYVCNYLQDNSAKAQSLFDALLAALKPARTRIERVIRGDLSVPDEASGPLELEWLNKEMAYGLRTQAHILSEKSPWQEISIFDTQTFGLVMKIDDHFMTSERDEFFYHEALVHPAAIVHPNPRSALIIGGGDGGTARQLLRHPDIKRITLVELDEAVLRTSRTYLGNIHQGSLDNPRVNLHIGDGLQYLSEQNDHHDLILFDLTDPDTPAHPLYTPNAFTLAKQRLSTGGIFVAHIGSPTFGAERVRSLIAALRSTFAHVRLYGTYIPLYGCYWCMAMCFDAPDRDPLQIDEKTVEERLTQRGITGLSLYSPRMHTGLFALPAFVEAMLK